MGIAIVRHLPLDEAFTITPTADQALIMICDPGAQQPLPPHWGHVLAMQFLDRRFDENALRQLYESGALHQAGVLFDEDLALAVRHFVADIDAQGISELIVACHGRVTQARSAAVAAWVAEQYGAVWPTRNDAYNPLVYALLQMPERHRETIGLAKQSAC